MTFLAAFATPDFAILGADSAVIMRLPTPAVPVPAWPIVGQYDQSKLRWHTDGWTAATGVATWGTLGGRDGAVGNWLAQIREAAPAAIVALEATDPDLATHVRDKHAWAAVGLNAGRPLAALVNWRGDVEPAMGRLAVTYPPGLEPADVQGFVNACQAVIQDAADGPAAARALAQLLGDVVTATGGRGVSGDLEVGIVTQDGATWHGWAMPWEAITAGDLALERVRAQPPNARVRVAA